MPHDDDALAQLRDLLAQPAYGEGDKLPAERRLARELGVSRRALRNAFAVLEAEGKVWRGVGQGTFVGRKAPRSKDDYRDLARSVQPADAMEARIAIEPVLARFAAQRATSEDVHELQTCAAKGSATTDPHTFDLWDQRFHEALARAAHNDTLAAAFEVVAALSARVGWGRAGDGVTAEWRRIFLRQHRAILEAIEARDVDWAENLMLEHLHAYRSVVLPEPMPVGKGGRG